MSSAGRLSLARQCQLLGLPRSSFYYQPETESPENLGLMRMMDEEHTEHPFLGVRGMTLWLNRATGSDWNPKRVRRLMRKMGLEAIYPKPHTSMPGLGHTIFPYLLRTIDIRKPNQVWCSDITYIPMGKGYMFLVAVMDWFSRRTLAWRLSNSLTADFCIEALDASFAAFGAPEIFNTDQGSQFTSADFQNRLDSSPPRGENAADGPGSRTPSAARSATHTASASPPRACHTHVTHLPARGAHGPPGGGGTRRDSGTDMDAFPLAHFLASWRFAGINFHCPWHPAGFFALPSQ